MRQQHLKDEPVCQWCGGKIDLDVHHILPFSKYSCLELSWSNLITLCNFNRCHFLHGHNGKSWSDYNVEIEIECNNRKLNEKRN